MLARLVNTTNEILTFDLTRDLAPKRHVFARSSTDKNGVTSRFDRRLILPESVSLLAKETRDGFHPMVANCPQVAALVRARKLRIEQYEPPAEAPQDPEVDVHVEQAAPEHG